MGSAVSEFVRNCTVLTDGYVMCVVYKTAVIAVTGYMWEEFGVLFIFVSCARLVMTILFLLSFVICMVAPLFPICYIPSTPTPCIFILVDEN